MSFTTHGDYQARTRASFAAQAAMATLGIRLDAIRPGEVRLSMPFRPDLTQQHGFLHAGIVTSAMDTAAGFAAYSLMPEDAGVLTIELKTSLMSPGRGARFEFVGRVIKPGRSIVFTEATAHAIDGDARREIARLSASMMVVQGRADVTG